MVGEVYNYYVNNGRLYDYGDRKVDFYEDAFDALINFDFKTDAHKSYESIFTKYDSLLYGPMKGKTILNYISSHDDGGPYDLQRERPLESATKLLLTQGGAQIYYGDELARSLTEEAEGDAKLRSFMNWEDLKNDKMVSGHKVSEVLNHWQKLGTFRNNHPSIGAGRHMKITEKPYVFSRKYSSGSYSDQVVIGLDLKPGKKILSVGNIFEDGTSLSDQYSGTRSEVKGGKVILDTKYDIVLLEKSMN